MRALYALALAACSSSPAPERPRTFGGDRPVDLQVPEPFDGSKHYPLIVVLHGYGASGVVQEAVFGINALPKAGEAFVLAPDGNVDSLGHEFWNADPACCDYDHTMPDDVGYLGGLIDDVSAAWPVDRGAVYVMGHSNGGYMAYRLACDRADVITNIMVLAGVAVSDPSTCHPAAPVAVLHLTARTTPRCPTRRRPAVWRSGPTSTAALRHKRPVRRSISTRPCPAPRRRLPPTTAARQEFPSSYGRSRAPATSPTSISRRLRPSFFSTSTTTGVLSTR